MVSRIGGTFTDIPNNGAGIPAGTGFAGSARIQLGNAPRVPFISQNAQAAQLWLGFPLSWGANAPANSTFFGHWSFAQNAAEQPTQIPAPFRGSLYRLSVRATDANWSAAGRVFTLRKAGVGQFGSAATVLGTNLTGQNGTATLFNRGDLLSVQLTGGALTNRIWVTAFLVPTG